METGPRKVKQRVTDHLVPSKVILLLRVVYGPVHQSRFGAAGLIKSVPVYTEHDPSIS